MSIKKNFKKKKKNSRHLEFVTLAELRSSLPQPSIDKLLGFYNLVEPEIADHFLCLR